MLSGRNRYVILPLCLLSLLLTSYYLRPGFIEISIPFPTNLDGNPPLAKSYPKYKSTSTLPILQLLDNFPFAASAYTPADLPPLPSWNAPPSPHVPESTPLYIGFTRNWRLLQQVVVSYITAGWPAGDIYVVENTGVMNANKHDLLTLQNPFFLNHTRLHLLGVNVLITPTLLTFAQLQNFYIWHSTQQNWTHYFWSHMDVVALSFEDQYAASHPTLLTPSDPAHDYSDFPSIYKNCLAALREVTAPSYTTKWAIRFFSYDRLALVNVHSMLAVGGWDTLIPFYMTDCDMHARFRMEKYDIQEVPGGIIFDVASSLEDLVVLYRKSGMVEASFKNPDLVEKELVATAKKGELAAELESIQVTNRTVTSPTSNSSPDVHDPSSSNPLWKEDTIYSSTFIHIISILDAMQVAKATSKKGRNAWQARQKGGEGEPFYRDAEGFAIGIEMTIEHGRRVFAEKWGHRDCDISEKGLQVNDAWRVEKDWKP